MLVLSIFLIIRAVIFEDTSTDIFFDESGNLSIIAIIIIVIPILAIWFGSGLILALWVNKDLKKRKVGGLANVILVFLTSFVGFLIYIMVRDNENCEFSDNPMCDVEETIKAEKFEESIDKLDEELDKEEEDSATNTLKK